MRCTVLFEAVPGTPNAQCWLVEALYACCGLRVGMAAWAQGHPDTPAVTVPERSTNMDSLTKPPCLLCVSCRPLQRRLSVLDLGVGL